MVLKLASSYSSPWEKKLSILHPNLTTEKNGVVSKYWHACLLHQNGRSFVFDNQPHDFCVLNDTSRRSSRLVCVFFWSRILRYVEYDNIRKYNLYEASLLCFRHINRNLELDTNDTQK